MLTELPPQLLGLRRGKVESWFMKANAPDGTRALWTRCTVFAQPGLSVVAESWAVAFDRHRGHVAVKSTVPFESARFASDDVDCEVDGCRLQRSGASGALTSGRGTLEWQLAFGPPLSPPIQHYPALFFYRDALPPFSKVVTPIADARAAGKVVVVRGTDDRDVWTVDDWPMMIGHNWGRGNAELYAWIHGNAWEIAKAPAELAFEAVSGRVRVGPLLTPMRTSAFLRFRGRSWDLNTPRAMRETKAALSLRRWEMAAREGDLELACEVAAETDDVVGLHYPNPNGPMTYCLNTKLARARLDLTIGGETIVATSRAVALEIGTVDPDHGIRMVL